jgi:hypothetical protein
MEAISKALTLPELREGWGTPKFGDGCGCGGRVGHPQLMWVVAMRGGEHQQIAPRMRKAGAASSTPTDPSSVWAVNSVRGAHGEKRAFAK